MTGSTQRPAQVPADVSEPRTEPSDTELQLTELTRLASRNPSYLETIRIDRALTALSGREQRSHTAVRLMAVGNATLDHLLPAIRVAGLTRQLLIDAASGRFGQYRQELLGPDSPVESFRPTVLLLSLTAGELLAAVPLGATRTAADDAVANAVADLRSLWRTARERFGAAIVQQSFLDVAPPLFGSHERLIPGSPSRLVARFNERVADAAAEDGAALLDVAAAAARDGLEEWFDERHWLQGKLEIAPNAAGRYGRLVARLIGAQLGRSRKCLVLDLDNTLWGGVLGDDGIEGVKLGQGSSLGEAHLALQRYAKRLKERGVVLAVCSKNEWPLVESMFDSHPEMCLRRADIAAFAVNWGDKAENLRDLAARLNLGLESFVFVDDNPAERARIRESLPMVAVPELPDEPARYVRTIAEEGYFEAVVLTAEDAERTTQYTGNAARDAMRASATSMDDFLLGLGMSMTFGPVRSVDIARATQLVNKTNQFNTTTLRLTAEAMREWAEGGSGLVLQFRLADRFGDNGLVSVMLFAADSERPGVLDLDNWVMSCRVFGRRLEHEALNVAVKAARDRGFTTIAARYVPTPKNVVVRNLFADLSFRRVEEGPDGASRWELDVAPYEPHSTAIARNSIEEGT